MATRVGIRRDTLTKLMESAATISAARDEKLTRLKEVIARKIENPINEDNKKSLFLPLLRIRLPIFIKNCQNGYWMNMAYLPL